MHMDGLYNVTQQPGQHGPSVSKYIDVPYLVYAFIASYIGYAGAAIALRSRRASHNRVQDTLFLAAAALSVAGNAFLATNLLAHWSLRWTSFRDRLHYRGPLVVLSLVVPFLCSFLAFQICKGADTDRQTGRIIARIVAGGVIAGLGHIFVEVINVRTITNFDVSVTACHRVYASLLSCAGSTAALAFIFRLRYHWAARWMYLLALCLVTSVITLGVEAILMSDVRALPNARTVLERSSERRFHTSAQVLLLVIACITCLALLTFLFWTLLQHCRTRSRAKQVSIAAIFFDPQGHVLIQNHDGGIPVHKITSTHADFSSDVFDASSAIFRWMLNASTSWHLIAPMLVRMRLHVASCEHSTIEASRDELSVYLRELFCCGAQQLADKLGIPLRKMGICFDRIAHTGEIQQARRLTSLYPRETGIGHIIFLVKHVEEQDVEHYLSNGLRFANPLNMQNSISASLNLAKDDVHEYLRTMWHYAPLTSQWRPGLHVGCFGVQARIVGGFQILVPPEDRTCLPVAFVQDHMLREECLAFVRKHYGKSLREVLLHCDSDMAALDMEIKAFRSRLMHALNRLQTQIHNLDFDDAFLLPELIRLETRDRGTTQLLLFKYAIPIHAPTVRKQLEFVPFSVFNLFQQMQGPELQTAFMRSLHTEFTPIFDLLGAGGTNHSLRTLEDGHRPKTRHVSRMFEGVMVQEAIEMRIDRENSSHDVSSTSTFTDDHERAQSTSPSGRNGLEKQVWVLENYPELPTRKPSPILQYRSAAHRAQKQPQVTSAAVAGETEVLTWAEVALRTRPNFATVPSPY